MSFRLPPLNTLRLFEAAGRRLSFKLAAEELHVTPSAVSHGIQALEGWLGVPLFLRTGRGLALTKAGAAYLPCVREALTVLALGTERVPGRAPSGKLFVSAAPTFASRWLLPRLPDFHAAHPAIEIVIDTSHRQVEFPLDGVDLAIRRGKGAWPGLSAVKLTAEELVPVCAPRLRPERPTAADLGRLTLIHVSSVTEDWAAWVGAAGLRGVDIDRGLRVDTIQMAFEAAIQGLGVAIGRKPLVDGDLADGRLVTLLGPAVKSAAGYWLVCAEESVRRPEVAAFRRWIAGQLAAGRDREALSAA